MALQTFRVDGVGGLNQWALYNGTDKADNINNTPANDARGIQAFAPGAAQAFSLENMPSNVYVITAVTFRARVEVIADPGILTQLRCQLVVSGLSTPTVGFVDLTIAETTPTEVTIGSLVGLNLSKTNGDNIFVQCRSRNGSGWVLGNAILRVLELYVDIRYIATFDLSRRGRMEATIGEAAMAAASGAGRMVSAGSGAMAAPYGHGAMHEVDGDGVYDG